MNLDETVELIEALKSAGATYFKSHDLEVSFNHSPVGSTVVTAVPPTPTPQVDTPKDTPTVAPTEEVNKAATEKVVDLINTLKMNDEQLANQIFPNGAL